MPTPNSFPIIDPSTGASLGSQRADDPTTLDAWVDAAAEAQRLWAARPLAERGSLFRRVAGALRAEVEGLAGLMADQMGKPVVEGRSEVEKCAWLCEHYASAAQGYLADEPLAVDGARAYITHRPLGVVLGVMPWNYPLWQVFRFAVPALVAGNAALLKHAPNVPGVALAIARIFGASGLPTALFRALFVEPDALEAVLARQELGAATLTGSERAGRAFASRAGAHLVPTVLELGGSDAAVVLADADLDAAAEAIATSRLLNSGQSCIATKRVVVEASVHDALVQRLAAAMARRQVGLPRDEATQIGPMARADLRDTLVDQVRRSVAAGARARPLGDVPAGPGYWFPPTLLLGCAPGMPAADEELFGPVLAVLCARDVEDAVRLANHTRFGLGASVYTADIARGEALARDALRAGSCFVNAFVRSDPRVPFGGVRASGYGRELGRDGILAFTNRKTVWVSDPAC